MMFRSIFQVLASLIAGIVTMTVSLSTQADPLAEPTSGIVGWISIEPATAGAGQTQMLAIAGRALSLRQVEGRYSLQVKRHGKGGSSNSRQGGAITLKPGVAATLSQSAINIGPGDALDIELKLFIDDREVFSASIRSTSGDLRL
jgi:hypothetical protein